MGKVLGGSGAASLGGFAVSVTLSELLLAAAASVIVADLLSPLSPSSRVEFEIVFWVAVFESAKVASGVAVGAETFVFGEGIGLTGGAD
jgi:hypothetical protein